MKNLKNRPQFYIRRNDGEYVQQSEEWFEDFEKRQRQNLADYENAIKNTESVNDPCFIRCWEALRNYIKKEILGE